jgi:hypothetical protein
MRNNNGNNDRNNNKGAGMRFLSLLSLVFIAAGFLVSTAVPADKAERRPAASLASLPVPAAAGALRILLVDDDWSENNRALGNKRLSPSDTVFRRLVADAVGGNATAWAVETVEAYKDGPGFDRLAKFNLIVWYTGANYGGGADNAAALSVEDEKTVRRYLEEIGGAVVLVSPGYAERALGYASTWEKSEWPFLSEVMGVKGGVGMAQRFEAGTVTTADGKQFSVGKGAPPETQFSAVNPDGAAVLMTSLLKSKYSTGAPMPVAIANGYGRGRIVYVGFTFENLVDADRAPAFQALLAATGLASKIEMTAPRRQAPVKQAGDGPLRMQVTGTPTAAVVKWALQSPPVENATISTPGQTTATRRRASPPLQQAPGQPPPVTVERLVPNAPSVRLAIASPDAYEARDPGPLTPGQAVTYRVTVTDAKGASVSKEETFTPPLPKDPDRLDAEVQADGSVILSWLAVPGVASYRVQVLSGDRGPIDAKGAVVEGRTEWRSPRLPPGARTWAVSSFYLPGGTMTAANQWPTAQTNNIPVLPTPRVPFLSLPNGPGSHAASQAHFRTRCNDALLPGSLCTAAGFIRQGTDDWDLAWARMRAGELRTRPIQWPVVELRNTLDLVAARRVNCAPRKNGKTVCWATSHINWNIPSSMTVIVMEDDKAFFGSWEMTPERLIPPRDHEGLPRLPSEEFFGEPWWDDHFLNVDHSFANFAELMAGAAFDSQGRKGVPHACLSCHGGVYNPVTKQVTGASLLPVVPARVKIEVFNENFDNYPDFMTRRDDFRRINHIILQSNPAPAIVDQINALYNGTPGTPGTMHNNAAVPSGWREQTGLYKKVIEPFCASCHFAQRGPMNFRSWSNMVQNKDAVQRSICTDFTMPHSETLFKKFWQDGNGAAPALLSTSLGFQKCR